MKTAQGGIALFAFLGLILAGCSDDFPSPTLPIDPAFLQKAILTEFTLTHYPAGLTGEGEIQLVGSNWEFRDFGVIEIASASDPLVSGSMIHHLCGTLDAVTGEGPMHGTWTLTPGPSAEGGRWEGNYHGYRSRIPGNDTLFALPLKVSGRGIGGTIDGLHMSMETVITAWGTPPTGWYAVGAGVYKSHGEK